MMAGWVLSASMRTASFAWLIPACWLAASGEFENGNKGIFPPSIILRKLIF
jgi:hypothetical protein